MIKLFHMIEVDTKSTILGVIPLFGQSTIGGRPGRQAKPALLAVIALSAVQSSTQRLVTMLYCS